MAKAKKIRKSSMDGKLAPVISATEIRIKKRPRGKSFEKGNGFGSEFRFVKGFCANPGGRPKTAKLSEAIREGMALDSTRRLPLGTNAQVMAAKVIHEAKKGNLAAITLAGDRAEGRPATSLTVNDGRDIFQEAIYAMNHRYEVIGPPDESGLDSSDDDGPRLLGEGDPQEDSDA